MMLPNLLNMAMTLVGTQQFTYFKFLSRATNSIGVDVAVYDTPKLLTGQVQAVPRNLFEQFGLDFQRSYLTFFVSKDIHDVERDMSGDQIKFANDTYQCLSETDWFKINGWTGILAVKI